MNTKMPENDLIEGKKLKIVYRGSGSVGTGSGLVRICLVPNPAEQSRCNLWEGTSTDFPLSPENEKSKIPPDSARFCRVFPSATFDGGGP